MWNSSFPNSIYKGVVLSLKSVLSSLLKDKLDVVCGYVFVVVFYSNCLYFCSVFFFSANAVSVVITLYCIMRSDIVMPLGLFLLFKIVFAFWDLFHFNINFRIILTNFL